MVYPPVCAAGHRSARLRSGIVNSDVLTTRSSGDFSLGHAREGTSPCAASESTHQINRAFIAHAHPCATRCTYIRIGKALLQVFDCVQEDFINQKKE